MQKWLRALLIPLLCFTFYNVLLFIEGLSSDILRGSPLQAYMIFVIVHQTTRNLCLYDSAGLHVVIHVIMPVFKISDLWCDPWDTQQILVVVASSQNHSKKGFWHNSQEEEDLITWYIRIERRIYKNKLIESFCIFNVKCGPSNFIYFRRLISQI